MKVWILVFMMGFGAHEQVQAKLEPEPGTQDDDIPLVSQLQEAEMDAAHRAASGLLLSAAVWLDSFFDNERYLAEENASRARLRLSLGYSRFDHLDFSPRLRLRLKLPRLSEKAFLVISASDDDDFATTDDTLERPADKKEEQEKGVDVGLRYFLFAGDRFHISTTFGMSTSHLYGGLRYRYLRQFDPWLGRLSDTVRWYTDDGWENKITVDMERVLGTHWLFRASGELDWYEGDDSWPHSFGAQLSQAIDTHRALQYEVATFFDTESNYHLTNWRLRLRYRQRLYRDWLIFEIAPQVAFPDEHDRKLDPGIIIRLEADFGHTASKSVFQRVFDF